MRNPCVFFVGCQRSGTTLLQHMVDSHPSMALLPEAGWFGTWFDLGMGMTPQGGVTREIVPMLLRTHKNLDLGATEEELTAMVGPDGSVFYADYISAVFDRCAKARGKAKIGTKNPDYLRRLPTLRKLWPEAKFVHIIRDGRDVCLSASLRWKDKADFRGFPFFLYEKPDRVFDTWAEDPVVTTALWWEWTVRLGREFGAALPRGEYHEMRYESLVADPEGQSRALCEFLEIPFDEAMLQHERNFKPRRGGDGKVLHASVALPVTAGLRDWRSQMTRDEIERFEGAAGGLLDELRYERAAAPPPPSRARDAARVRAAFEALTGGAAAPVRTTAEKAAPVAGQP